MKFKTIIIDDDELVVFVSKKLIISSNFDKAPISFSNGKEALEYLENEKDPHLKHIIFLDINMPVMNGWEFLEGTRKLFISENLLIFMVSSSTNQADKLKASQYESIIKYIEKPVHVEIFEKLKQLDQLRGLFNHST